MARMPADLFGSEPEPPPSQPHMHSVTEITRAVRSVLEENIGVVWVEGEVSNHRKQPSGHQYFTLKDAGSQLPCVWFARSGMRLRQVALADGMLVQVRGALTVYEARGQYQLSVQIVQAAGAGLLQAKFEALKRKLDEEGLFDPERKRAIPRFPRTIGIVSSPTGAALRDILNILTRRAPGVSVIVNPVRVQGAGAAAEIAAAIAEFNRFAELGLTPVDVLIVGRGGGSVEDLWEFNEEVVARAIAASTIPIVSAVGHEIDFTIADFVADLRAPTPSAAAELVVPDCAELQRRISQLGLQLRRQAMRDIEQRRAELDYLAKSALFREPRERVEQAAQRLDLAADALGSHAARRIEVLRSRLGELAASLRQHRPDQILAMQRQNLATLTTRLAERTGRIVNDRRQRFGKLAALLRLLSPDATLARGYSITTLETGAPLTSVLEAPTATRIATRLRDGVVHSTVE
jgi:exodeoxyribonuclease VII large subunit